MRWARSGLRAWAASALALLAFATLPSASFAQEAPPPAAARVVGLELDRKGQYDRLLVLTRGAVAPRLEENGPEQLTLHIPNATLDPKAPRQVVPGVGSGIRAVSAADSEPPGAEVLIRVRRAPGSAAQLSHQDGLVALELERPAAEAERVTLRLINAPLSDLVRRVQQITQKRFVYDDRLQGSATVIVNEAVTPGEALEILHTTLLSKGFAAVPAADGSLLVLPIDEARARAPIAAGAVSAERAGLITTLVRFRSIDAEQLVKLLQPFAGASLTVIAYEPTNGAILIGSEAVLKRWLELARSLDETSRLELAVIRPRYRTAAELLGLLDEAVRDPLTGRARVELVLDERTNALIVRAEPKALAALRAQIAELDVAPEYDGEIAVIRPRFADPQNLAKILQAVASGTPAGAGQVPSEAAALSGVNFTVALHPSTGSLLISGDAASQRLVRGVVEELDRQPPTIRIELQVLEVKATGQLALGFDAFIPTTDPAKPGRSVFGVGVGDPFGGAPGGVDPTFIARWARNPFVVPIVGPGGIPVIVLLPREIVQITAAAGEVALYTLMRPHLLALSGEEHELVAGLNVPVPTAAAESAGGGDTRDPLSTNVSIERQDVGLRVRLKPVAGQAGDVRIAVDVEVTNLAPSLAGDRTEIGPTLESRTLQAHTRVEDGGAAVLAMLLEKNDGSFESAAPYLKDVPVVGNLFRKTLEGRGARHLVIAIQARIERSADERLADTIRLRTAHERALARSGSLRDQGWALLVATRTTRADADALAEALGEIAGKRARVVAWEWADAERFDVVLSGFESIRDAAGALPAVEAVGWQAELVALPEE